VEQEKSEVPSMSVEIGLIFLGWAIGKALDSIIELIKKIPISI
jgi:hypothetical protein